VIPSAPLNTNLILGNYLGRTCEALVLCRRKVPVGVSGVPFRPCSSVSILDSPQILSPITIRLLEHGNHVRVYGASIQRNSQRVSATLRYGLCVAVLAAQVPHKLVPQIQLHPQRWHGRRRTGHQLHSHAYSFWGYW
jgi:hypothetical protein